MNFIPHVLFFLFLFLPTYAFSGKVIIAEEIQSCLYADGEMICSGGEYKNTYYLDGQSIVRTNVYSFKKKESSTDNTVYQIFKGLTSDPQNNTGEFFPQVIRAISVPGNDTIETIAIDKKYIHTIRSVSNYYSISRYKIVTE